MSFGTLLFTPLVKKLQERYGSRRQYERMEDSGASQDRFTEFETQFLAQRDSFYMATLGATGWPYVQHRGGPKGFLKVIDDHTLAFGDLRGNKQYITTGNLLTDDRVALIMPKEKTPIERVLVIHVEAYDWNCPQHITPRYSVEELREGMKDVEKRLQSLEQENEALRKELAAARPGSKA
jgi:predicted pyridoxine 5'-phosphate oxidase superfamily flavin-nucleotide-binding protein